MTHTSVCTLLAALLLLLVLLPACNGINVVDSGSIDKKVVFGYQGWFGCIGDDFPGYDWRHWSRDGGQTPSVDGVAFDSFPDLSEYPSECLYATNMTYANGSVVKLFDAACPGTTALHFKWLYDYGLHGVFLQRFLGEVTQEFASWQAPWWKQRNAVLRNVMAQAKAWGRVFALEYDISGEDPNNLFGDITADWNFLVHNLSMIASPRYLHQNGKPVVVIWGMGFSGRGLNRTTCLTVINWFKSQGCFVVGGVPFNWREDSGDSEADFADVYHAFDVVHPWAVGRYHSIDAYQGLRSYQEADKNLTDSLGIGYAPVVFPGFSWANLMTNPDIFNEIPRDGGRFFSAQAEGAIALAPQFIFIAMFDEVNEGTAMFKLASRATQLPVGGNFTYQSLDGVDMASDAYLVLARNLTRSFSPVTPSAQSAASVARHSTLWRLVTQVFAWN